MKRFSCCLVWMSSVSFFRWSFLNKLCCPLILSWELWSLPSPPWAHLQWSGGCIQAWLAAPCNVLAECCSLCFSDQAWIEGFQSALWHWWASVPDYLGAVLLHLDFLHVWNLEPGVFRYVLRVCLMCTNKPLVEILARDQLLCKMNMKVFPLYCQFFLLISWPECKKICTCMYCFCRPICVLVCLLLSHWALECPLLSWL